MKSITVTLGGEVYVIHELPVRQNAAWRKLVETRLGLPLSDLWREAQRAAQIDLDGNLKNITDLNDLVRSASGLLLSSIDTLVDLFIAYVPELTRNREQIEDRLYESEILEAFTSVLTLGFPLAALAERLGPVIAQIQALGSPNKPTGTNSPVPPGDSGATN